MLVILLLALHTAPDRESSRADPVGVPCGVRGWIGFGRLLGIEASVRSRIFSSADVTSFQQSLQVEQRSHLQANQ